MKALFFAAFAIYGAAVILEFTGTAFKKDRLLKAAWYVFLAAFAVHLVFIVARGIAAKRLPLSNQFEFANTFAWGVALMLIVMRPRLRTDWLSVVAMPATLLVMTYAALQPMEIKDLMPALRSAWFGVHIGSAVLSYAAFVIAGCIGLRYLLSVKKGSADERALAQMDYISYRMVAFGFLFLTVVILSGAIWAEQAWSAFWTWDPKEVWALITWIIYAVYLHLRLRMKRKGKVMAWFLVIAVPIVFFTFAGVNTLMHGMHTYG
ncbi:MAG: c-type cytochrome biogenesis protein CcsB [Oscillospiraceae bacterium]|nr:c-type cytochrome biogenesis protein CcsB [Oscillospiraceae bacterium]